MLEKQWDPAENRRQLQHKITMGKKHIIETNQEDLIKEQEKIDKTAGKEVKVKPAAGGILEGKIFVSSSYNNTIITLTNSRGQVLAWKSAGSVGFKGTKKATSFAASRVAEAIANICKKLAIEKIEVLIKGIGAGRESSIRTLVAQGLNIIAIRDITPVPHNGCRLRKTRRV